MRNIAARLRVVLDVTASIAMIGAAGAVVWILFNRPAPVLPSAEVSAPSEPIGIPRDTTMGRSDAPVVLTVFADFECPFCGAFARDTLPSLVSGYVSSGKVQIAFRHLPLRIHARAERAAHAAECAATEQRFWPMHDLLFANQSDLTDPALVKYAAVVGVNAEAFAGCMNDEVTARIADDVSLAGELGIRSTPVFLIGRRESAQSVRVTSVLMGARPLTEFHEVLTPLLKSG